MQIRQTITFSKEINGTEGKMTRISRNFMYMPKVTAAPNLEIKWHEEVYKKRQAV